MKVFLKCYESYELNLIHYCQEIMEKVIAFQKIRIQHPNNPFYDYNNRLLINIQEDDTIL